MKAADPLPASVLRRRAVVYVRQSTVAQVLGNLESQRRQYDLAKLASEHGFRDVEVIDEDLGRSASGTTARPGFDRLVAELCAGSVGAVLCLEASRLARNGRDWHHLLELCGLVDARVIDLDGVYDPRQPNDRLLLGMKGTISEFELGILRSRLYEAVRAKARRGALRIPVPIGYSWERESGVRLDPDLRVQEVIRLVLHKFEELGSARQVHIWMSGQGLSFPRPSDGKRTVSFEWTAVRYRNVMAILKNPFYAGTYAYGKSGTCTDVVDGHARKIRSRAKPIDQWDVLLKDHHAGYLSWAQFERNQTQLSHNSYGQRDGAKSGRGGRALLASLLTCRRCGHRLTVVYTGKSHDPKYRCDQPNLALARKRCMGFGAWRPDQLVTDAVLQAVEPAALLAAQEAQRMQREQDADSRRVADLELTQARYEAALAERRYAACDPDNRLIAAQLETAWEQALQRVRACEERISARRTNPASTSPEDLRNLAGDLKAAWAAPSTTMRTKQQLVRALVKDIVADVDEVSGEIVLVVHWKGGRHTELRTPKPKTGEHRRRAGDEAAGVIRAMAGKWSDDHVAASLNRLGLRTGQNQSWTGKRVVSWRAIHGVSAYRPAIGDGEWVTMTQAAGLLGVTNHVIRRLIRDGDLKAEQVVPCAPYQIRAADLRSDTLLTAIRRHGRPCRSDVPGQRALFPGVADGGAQ